MSETGSGAGSESGRAIARAALALTGVPFRLHGRDPAYGLDCVGLVAVSMSKAGFPAEAPVGYSLRNSDITDALLFAETAGLRDVALPAITGDILLTRPGPGQFHLLICGECGGGDGVFVHAHAGLRKVVSMPGPLASPILKHWRYDPELQG